MDELQETCVREPSKQRTEGVERSLQPTFDTLMALDDNHDDDDDGQCIVINDRHNGTQSKIHRRFVSTNKCRKV